MENIKKEYKKKLEDILKITEDAKIDFFQKEKYDNLLKEIDEFSFKIPIVGPFNAGKSSLINTYCESEVLPVALRPETSIATELKYGKPRIKAYQVENKKMYDEFPIEKISEINLLKYSHIEVYLPTETLLYKNFTLVDMPGLDSGILEHNKAIMNYISEGSYFILLSDCDQGGLKEETLRFMQELDEYGLKFGVLINKIDKKIPSQIQEITENVKEIIKLRGFSDIFVGVTTTREPDGLRDFETLLSQIDYKKIFQNKFDIKINTLLEEIIYSLEIRLTNLNLDTDEIDEKRLQLEKDIKKLEKNLERETIIIRNHLKTDFKYKLLNDIKNTLNNNSKALARTILNNNNDDFSRKVNEILRPVLVQKLKTEIEILYDNLNTNISLNKIDISLVAESMRAGLDNTERVLQTAADTVKRIQDLSGNKKKLEKTFKYTTTALAVTTSVVAPWLEIIIIFLPDIFKLLGIGSEENQIKKIEIDIKDKIVPEIISKFSNELDVELEKVTAAMIKEKEDEINNQKDLKTKSYVALIKEKDENEFKFNSYREKIETCIQLFQNFIVRGV